MKKLLIATDSFMPRFDGIARFLYNLLPHLVKEFEVTVIAPDFANTAGQVFDYPCNIVRIPLMRFVKIAGYYPARFERKQIRHHVLSADIIWIQTNATIGATVAKIAKKLHKPYCCYVHSIDWQLVYHAMEDESILKKPFAWYAKHVVSSIYRNASVLMVPSSEVREILDWNKIRTPTTIVRLGIDTNYFVPATSIVGAKRALDLDVSKTVIGYVNRISNEKDLITLYRAFIHLEKKNPNILLLVVGEGEIQHKVKMKQNRHVKFVGAQKDVLSYLQAMDIFVLPSNLETTSLATLEAMSCALPVIACPVGLVKEYIHEKQNGLLFPKKNSLVLSLKLEWLINNPAKMLFLGKNARKTVVQEYNWNDTVESVIRVLKTLN